MHRASVARYAQVPASGVVTSGWTQNRSANFATRTSCIARSHCSTRKRTQPERIGRLGRDGASDQCHYPGIIKVAHVGRSAAAEGETKASAKAQRLLWPNRSVGVAWDNRLSIVC